MNYGENDCSKHLSVRSFFYFQPKKRSHQRQLDWKVSSTVVSAVVRPVIKCKTTSLKALIGSCSYVAGTDADVPSRSAQPETNPKTNRSTGAPNQPIFQLSEGWFRVGFCEPTINQLFFRHDERLVNGWILENNPNSDFQPRMVTVDF